MTGIAIGAFIRGRRMSVNRSQRDVAQQTSLRHQVVLSRVEDGTRPLRFTEAVELAALLDFTLEELAAVVPAPEPCATCGNEPPLGMLCTACRRRGGS